MFPVSPFVPLRPVAALVVAVALAATVPAVRAVTPFVIQDIRVEGLQRTDPGTVFAALPFRIGDTYTDDKGSAALRSLFGTGLFKDVRLEIQDLLLAALSDRVMAIPELEDGKQLFAKVGFNVIATANTRDLGVNEMSAALKRRFNFETVFPIADYAVELALVRKGNRLSLMPVSEEQWRGMLGLCKRG